MTILFAKSRVSAPRISADTGQLKILKLRLDDQEQLGAQYDIRAFHDEILNGGALPLDVLEQRVNDWIAAQKSAQTAEK